MSDVYEYQPLEDKNSIRVLILGPGEGDGALFGFLEVIHLSNRTETPVSVNRAPKRRRITPDAEVTRWTAGKPYEAISYVWGSNKKDRTIFLGEKTHQITANLSDALRQCRFPDRPRILWADSICINQDDWEEKGHQVFMMGRIYASSMCTLICLGIDPNNRHHARNAFNVIYDTVQMIERALNSPFFSGEIDSFPRPRGDDPLGNDPRWKSVDTLLQHPWFTRGWVVQEAALGDDARILWAGCKISLLDLLRVDQWYFRRMADLVEKPREIKTPALLRRILFHVRMRESKAFALTEGDVQRPSILNALDHARDLGLSDNRDRVYAFMALPFVDNPMRDLRPDYGQSPLDLYQQFAKSYLAQTSDLNLLCYVTHKKEHGVSVGGDLSPSWVPRWDHQRWDPGHVRNGNFGPKSEESAEYMILFGDNGEPTLAVRAVIFDSIRLVSQRFQASMTIGDLVAVWSRFGFRATSASRQDEFRTAYDMLGLSLLRALSKGYLGAATMEEWATTLKSYANLLQKMSVGGWMFEPSSEIRSCHRTLMTLAHDSHIFMLQRGHYGLGPLAIKEDDVCAFVFGVCRPLILRKIPRRPGQRANHYNVIGPAYVVSKAFNHLGLPLGLSQRPGWENWDELWKSEGWGDWGLKEERIILQ